MGLRLSYKSKHWLQAWHGVAHVSSCCRADGRAFVYLPSPPLWATPHQ